MGSAWKVAVHAAVREVLAVVPLTQLTLRWNSPAVVPLARLARYSSWRYPVCQGQVECVAWRAVWAALQLNRLLLTKGFTKQWPEDRGDCLHCCIKFCVANLNNHGLRHAGEMHSSILPDSVMVDEDVGVGDLHSPRHIGLGIYKPDSACFGAMAGSPTMAAHTPRTENWVFKFGRHNCNCLDHGIRLSVARTLGHPLVRMSLGWVRRGKGKSHRWAHSRNAQNGSRGGHIRCLANRIWGGAPQIRAHDCTQELWLDARSCPP